MKIKISKELAPADDRKESLLAAQSELNFLVYLQSECEVES